MRHSFALIAVITIVACGSPAKAPTPEPAAPNDDKMHAFLAKHPEPREPAVAVAPVAPGVRGPTADMSKQLGGIRLGMSVGEFRSACRSAGGQMLDREADSLDLACTVVPVPLQTSGRVPVDLRGAISGRFCGDGATVCEVMYSVGGSPLQRNDQIEALLDLLAGKYGPPTTSEGYTGNDPMRPCSLGKPTHFKRSWYFGPKQTPPHPIGWVRIVFDCDARGGAISHDLMIFYDDEDGLRNRSDEYNERRGNF